MEQDNNLNIW